MSFICEIKKLKLCVCYNLTDVVCAVGVYELQVLIPGIGVVFTWQTGQTVNELRAEGRFA